MATTQERLDELLALAADSGRLGSEFTAAQKAHSNSARGHARTRARERMHSARKDWEAAERLLNKMRRLFLEGLHS
jgi:hypothetical protein